MAFTKKKSDAVADIALNIDPSRTYEFELVGPEFPPYKTIPRNIKVWDEVKQKIRTIRYVRTEGSPFLDEQNKEVPEEIDISFNRAKLFVPGTNAALIRFLLAHDGLEGKKMINPDNERFRNSYRLVDKDVKIVNELESRRLIAKAHAVIANADIDQLTKFMLSQFGYDANSLKDVTKKDEAVEAEAYTRAQSTPAVFVDDFNNQKHEYKSTVIYAFQDGLLDDSVDGEVHWKETKGLIYAYDQSKFMKATDALSAWIAETDEGKKFYSEIKAKLEAE